MVAKKAWIPAKGTYTVGDAEEPFNPTIGEVSHDPLPPSKMDKSKVSNEKGTSTDELIDNNEYLQDFLNIASLANLAKVHKSDADNKWHARGDPTEIAIQVFASRFNWNNSRWTEGSEPAWKQLAEFPFDSDVKRMSVIFQHTPSGDKQVFTKGAVERILDACNSIYLKEGEEAVAVTDEIKEQVIANMEAMASLGLRVLAFASRPYSGKVEEGVEIDRAEVEKDLTLRGLIGLYDPPRAESAHSVRKCQSAGITVHMVSLLYLPIFEEQH
jgi:Na+-exporting ATPase